MTLAQKRTGLVAVGAVLIAAAACNKPNEKMDDSLRQDLAAANTRQPQVVVSAVEAGEMAAPVHAAPRHIPRPTAKPAPRLAAARAPVQAPAPAPQPVVTQPAPQTPPAEPPPAPAPTQRPAPAERQHGTYKTEAEIFRQMPWIRP
jgi:DNA polymerase-3 subunit gamma/tau